ncbi:MAG: cytochrome-c peroxidase [Planctomycetia bacterium]|nr:cytochrome-c peroxidase [Planctomycetia bacterium]
MFGGRTRIASLLLLTSLFCRDVTADTSAANSYGVESFTQAELLRRFDSTQDRDLDETERAALCVSFGRIDVPMLPTKPYRYTDQKVPSHIAAAALRSMDNTPDDNPITDAGAVLGRVLFYDRQLSQNDTIACVSCHPQEKAFSDPRQFSVGFESGNTNRNAMSLVNLRYTVLRGTHPGFFWDERAPTLEALVLVPIQDKVEMGMELPTLENKLQQLPYYPPLFDAAFGSSKVSRDGIAKAVAQFMRSMVSFDSRFDRAAATAGGDDYSVDFKDFTAEENLGKSLFIDGVAGVTEIGCAHCHVPPTFSMPKSFNTGLDLYYVDQGLGARGLPPNDPLTLNNDVKFKASSLRNVALTAPYMHDGRFKTLERVVAHYSDGVHPHVNLELAFNEDSSDTTTTSGFRMTPAQKSAVVAFLKTLTDESLLADPRFSDPFVRVSD